MGIILSAKSNGFFVLHFETKRTMLTDLALMLLSLSAFLFIAMGWSAIYLALLLFLYGLDTGLLQNSNMFHTMRQAAKQQQASLRSLYRMIVNIGISFGAILCALTLVLTQSEPDAYLIDGIRSGWSMAASMIVFQCYVAWL